MNISILITLETVTIEEQQCRPNRCCTPYVCTPSPPIRQVKIRSRPSSCFDLNKKESTGKQIGQKNYFSFDMIH